MRRTAILLMAATLVIPASPAVAGVPETTCTFDEAAARVDISLVGYPNFLLRIGDEIYANHDCGDATVFNTDLIVVTDASPPGLDAELTIVPVDGPFAPGLTSEGPGSEIEIEVAFSGGHDTALEIHTDVGAQHISIDHHDINLNADELTPDDDVLVTGVGSCDDNQCYRLVVQTGSGDDVIEHRADPDDQGTVVALATNNGDDIVHSRSFDGTGTFILGGGGDDVLRADGAYVAVGGTGNDLIVGGAGTGDSIEGGTGHDRIFGRGGADSLSGGPGPDALVGDLGRDALSGDRGDDRLWGGSGVDDLDGGEGFDRCEAERGSTEERCEAVLVVPPPAL